MFKLEDIPRLEFHPRLEDRTADIYQTFTNPVGDSFVYGRLNDEADTDYALAAFERHEGSAVLEHLEGAGWSNARVLRHIFQHLLHGRRESDTPEKLKELKVHTTDLTVRQKLYGMGFVPIFDGEQEAMVLKNSEDERRELSS